MLLLSFLLASNPIMSNEDICRAANDLFGTSFRSIDEMNQRNPIVFSELANSFHAAQKVAFLHLMAAQKGCQESQVYLAVLLDRNLGDFSGETLLEEIVSAIEAQRQKAETDRKRLRTEGVETPSNHSSHDSHSPHSPNHPIQVH